VSDTAEVEAQINEGSQSKDFTSEYKEKRKLAKRIVKAVQPALEDATRKESELLRKPFEKELQQLDQMLENSLASRRDSVNGILSVEMTETEAAAQQLVADDHPHPARVNGGFGVSNHNVTPVDALGIFNDSSSAAVNLDSPVLEAKMGEKQPAVTAPNQPTPEHTDATSSTNGTHDQGNNTNGISSEGGSIQGPVGIQIREPPTPPMSTGGDTQPLSNGGIPWYMDTFDPDGSTIQEERWTGRELVRGMSEELSDMEDEELSGLMDVEISEEVRKGGEDGTLHPDAAEVAAARRKAAAKRRRWRGYR
jgi:NuA3 HAT complex component NTO1